MGRVVLRTLLAEISEGFESSLCSCMRFCVDIQTGKSDFLVYFLGPNLSSVCVKWSHEVLLQTCGVGAGGENLELASPEFLLIHSKGSVRQRFLMPNTDVGLGQACQELKTVS